MRCVVVTLDRGMAARARRARVQHVFIRVPEAEAEQRLRDHIDEIEGYLTGTALRVTVFKYSIRADAAQFHPLTGRPSVASP